MRSETWGPTAWTSSLFQILVQHHVEQNYFCFVSKPFFFNLPVNRLKQIKVAHFADGEDKLCRSISKVCFFSLTWQMFSDWQPPSLWAASVSSLPFWRWTFSHSGVKKPHCSLFDQWKIKPPTSVVWIIRVKEKLQWMLEIVYASINSHLTVCTQKNSHVGPFKLNHQVSGVVLFIWSLCELGVVALWYFY